MEYNIFNLSMNSEKPTQSNICVKPRRVIIVSGVKKKH